MTLLLFRNRGRMNVLFLGIVLNVFTFYPYGWKDGKGISLYSPYSLDLYLLLFSYTVMVQMFMNR